MLHYSFRHKIGSGGWIQNQQEALEYVYEDRQKWGKHFA